jgi:hypothetical protein
VGDVARWADLQRAIFSCGLTNASGCVTSVYKPTMHLTPCWQSACNCSMQQKSLIWVMHWPCSGASVVSESNIGY